MSPLRAQIAHSPFPEVAQAIRSDADGIASELDAAVRESMPEMKRPSVDEIKQSAPQILLGLADALASVDPTNIWKPPGGSPGVGMSQCRLHLDLFELIQEDRLLRAIIVQHIESGL